MDEVVKYLISQAGPLGILCAVLIVSNIAQWIRAQSERAKVEKVVEALVLSTSAISAMNAASGARTEALTDVLRVSNETLAKIESIRAYLMDAARSRS